MKTVKILEITPLAFGCELRREIVRSQGFVVDGDFDDSVTQDIANILESAPSDMEMVSAYSSDGGYIGDEKTARRLIYEYGIAPQRAKLGDTVCAIGFCEKEQKWYGWSHRAIYGFGLGSVVKRGDCGYVAPTAEAFGQQMLDFFCDEDHIYLGATHKPSVNADGVRGVLIEATYSDQVPNERIRGTKYSNFRPYPEKFGRGEWVAETMDDAKQMAIDFAECVS